MTWLSTKATMATTNCTLCTKNDRPKSLWMNDTNVSVVTPPDATTVIYMSLNN